MKRLVGMLALILLLLAVSSCESAQTYMPTESEALLKETLTLSFDASVPVNRGGISDEDYKKYNNILSYLNKYPKKSEDSLFAELAELYGESSETLKKFMNDNMIKAIQRDQAASAAVSKNEVQRLTEAFLQANINGLEGVVSTADADISITGQRAVSTIRFERGGRNHEAIIKFEFDSESQTARVYQLKIDGSNIHAVTE